MGRNPVFPAVGTLGLMAWCCATLALTGCASKPSQTPPATVEFRLAALEPAPGFVEARIAGLPKTFYLHEEALLTDADIESAQVIPMGDGAAVEVIFTAAGREEFARITEAHLEQPLGILVKGELVSAPLIRAPIKVGRAIITSDFTAREAQLLADSLNRP
jgi:preprotein translocase subunit SecD